MAKRSLKDIEKIWSNVEGVKKLSDRVVGIGPFGLGMDAMLTWVPIVGTVYTVGTGSWLMIQGVRANASPVTLLQMAAFMIVDTATGTVPVAGDVVDTFFPGQLLAAGALQREIEATHWVEDSRKNAMATGDHERHLDKVRSDKKLKRVVYLHS